MSDNIKKLTNQYNNYIYPKPCEDIETEWIQKNRYQTCDPNYHWHKLWPEYPYSRKKMNILVAGCGSDQAAILAKCNPIHNFIGIDLSEESLKHQKKLVKKHQIKNLKLICDDFRNQKFVSKFDYIISSGVTHHLDDPSSALKFFDENLLENGVLYLMVYGNQQSEGIKELKNVFKKLKFSQNQESIKNIKNLLPKLNIDHPSKIFLKYFNDHNYDAGVVDIFLHPKEKFYSIKELINELGSNNFVIKNFVDGKVGAVTKYFIDNPELLANFNKLSIEDRLDIAQILNWQDRKIDVVCSKTSNKKFSKIYNKLKYDDIYAYRMQNMEYRYDEEKIKILNSKDGSNFAFKFKNKKINWKKILSGQSKLSEMTDSFSKNEKNNFYNIIEFLIDNYLLDFSFNKIEDYSKYYNQ